MHCQLVYRIAIFTYFLEPGQNSTRANRYFCSDYAVGLLGHFFRCPRGLVAYVCRWPSPAVLNINRHW